MADCILVAEGQIGAMADRIVETQSIQNENTKLVASLTRQVINKFDLILPSSPGILVCLAIPARLMRPDF